MGGLFSRVLRFGTGISLEELIIRHAFGMDIGQFYREDSAAGGMMIPIPHAGIYWRVEGLEEALRQAHKRLRFDIASTLEVSPRPSSPRI